MADYDKPEEKKPAKATADKDDKDICKTALARYRRFHERERENINHAYEDLEFCWNDAQWSQADQELRKDRPTLTVNRLPQFVHQVTGDMRQMKPAIKVVAVDSKGDKDTAETIAGMLRYIENRSDAPSIYTSGADSQVSCGIGAWRINKEYAAESTFNQELRIVGVDDAVAIAWDPDAVLPTREDAKWCIVPVDMSRETFEEQYPDAPLEDFDDADMATVLGWFDRDFIRVAEYWVKKPIKRTLALMPDGSIIDLTDNKEPPPEGARIEKRDGFKVCRYLITAAHVLEGPTEWPGMHIPIIPVIGEEFRIGRKVVRRSLIRAAKDAQRMFNYFCSAHAEVVALQPKAPFMVTEKNVEKYQDQWAEANVKALPYLPYEPDAKNGGIAPQRVQPPVSSQGITEGIQLSVDNMKGAIGIYDAGLGNKSNETSGKAIVARQREGDIGSYVYIDNWTRAIRRTGAVLIDLIPHVYDSERMIRIMGEDGKVDLKWINKSTGLVEIDPETGEPSSAERIENDVTIGAYDVVLDSGPSYSTKREEAKEGMKEFVQASPESASVMLDLYAKAQDWPLADEIGQRFEAVAPPPVQALLKKQKQEQGEQEQPSPEEMQQMQAQQMQMQMQQMAMQLDLQTKQLTNKKLEVEIAQATQGEAPDQSAAIKAQGEAQKLQIDARRADQEHAASLQEMDIKRQMAAIELEIKLADLAIKKQGLALDTASAALDLESKQQGMVQEAERHSAGLVQGMGKHQTAIEQGAESHAAKVKQMQAKPEKRPAQ